MNKMEMQIFLLNLELNKVNEWLRLNKLSLNINKTKYMLFKTIKRKVATSLLLKINNTNISV